MADTLAELRERHEFWRGARWVAEEHLGGIVAIEAGYILQLVMHRWWLSIGVGIALFYGIARWYGRREEAAEKARFDAEQAAERS